MLKRQGKGREVSGNEIGNGNMPNESSELLLVTNKRKKKKEQKVGPMRKTFKKQRGMRCEANRIHQKSSRNAKRKKR